MNRNLLDQAFFSIQKTLKSSLHRIMSNPHDVDDVVQETYLRAVATNTSNSIKDPEAYFFRTSRNIALNQHAKMYRHLEKALPSEELDKLSTLIPDQANEMENDYDHKQQFAEFCIAVSELPLKCRKVFVLRKVYGLSQLEIAKKLDISVSTVETHISKGMQRTCESMSRKGEIKTPPKHIKGHANG